MIDPITIMGITMLVTGVNLIIIILIKISNKPVVTSQAGEVVADIPAQPATQDRATDGKFQSKLEPTIDNKIYIRGLVETGINNKEIAEMVGVHPSNIGRFINKYCK